MSYITPPKEPRKTEDAKVKTLVRTVRTYWLNLIFLVRENEPQTSAIIESISKCIIGNLTKVKTTGREEMAHAETRNKKARQKLKTTRADYYSKVQLVLSVID